MRWIFSLTNLPSLALGSLSDEDGLLPRQIYQTRVLACRRRVDARQLLHHRPDQVTAAVGTVLGAGTRTPSTARFQGPCRRSGTPRLTVPRLAATYLSIVSAESAL